MSLFDAVASRDPGALSQQLESGVLPDDFDSAGCTPLARAAEAGELELVRLLLAHGAEPAFGDRAGETPLMKAATHGHRDVYALLVPFAGADERDMAARLLRMSGVSQVPAVPSGVTPDRWRRALAEAGASLSSILGDDTLTQRLQRAKQGWGRKE